MKGNIAIIAALEGELKPLVNDPSTNWLRLAAPSGVELWEYRHQDGCWLAACAGMGADRARRAFMEAEGVMRIDAVCSAGWAGALDHSTSAGSVCWVKEVVDTGTGERFLSANWLGEGLVLATASRVADAKEKQRLASSYGAGLVDMEAAAVARIALARSLPFYCVKGVSDTADMRLPEINAFIGPKGRLKMAPFLRHVAVRPGTWRGVMKLGRNSSLAAQNLAAALYDWIDEGGNARKENVDFAAESTK